MKQYNGEPYIVSFTSFGKRIEKAAFMVWYLLTNQTYKNFHLVLTLHKDDVKHIGHDMGLLLRANLLELIVGDEDFGPHMKYYYAMRKYGDHPIITIDDDRMYTPTSIEDLVTKYESISYPSIISNCAIKMGRTADGHITGYPEWIPRRLDAHEKSYIAMAEGFAGILYPPNCYTEFLDRKSEMLKCKYDDDLYLTTLRIEKKLPVTQSCKRPNYTELENISEMMQYNLHNNQNAGDTNRINMCRLFESKLLQAFDLK